jgi:nucleoside-diphosphate-sugar epimerase
MTRTAERVLLLGATGRTGSLVLQELLGRGVAVRALVRSAARLPAGAAAHPRLTVVETDLATMPAEAWRAQVADVTAVVSCLGHAVSLRGVFGPPRDLVEGAVQRACAAIEARQPATPVRVVLMSSVSVHRPPPADPRRGGGERAFLAALRALVPPARDNQRAADALVDGVGRDAAFVAWAVVRPDTLVDGEAAPVRVEEGLVSGLFRPGTTRRTSLARFLADLATDDDAWARWRGTLPVVIDAAA